MKQKLPALMLAAAMLAAALSLGLTACGGEPSSTAGTDKPYVVGICQLTPHPALDEATRGFQDALEGRCPDRYSLMYKMPPTTPPPAPLLPTALFPRMWT